MNSGLITGLIAGPNRLSKAVLSRKQAIPGAEITQALSNLGVSRVALGSDVTRTSATGTTLTPTGLTALTVTLAQSSRYRLTYRLYASGIAGFKIGFTFPSALPTFDGSALLTDNIAGTGLYIYKDWPVNGFPSGVAVQDAVADSGQNGGQTFVADILTGSTANTFGDFSVVFAQSASNATASTMSKNSCVEVLKF
jgi:hypothetical protein